MPILRERYIKGENEADIQAKNVERAEGFTLRQIEDAMEQTRDRYQTLVMAA